MATLGELREAHRLDKLARFQAACKGTQGRLVQNCAVRARVPETVAQPGMRRLLAFLELLALYDKAPWANMQFNVNQGVAPRRARGPLGGHTNIAFAWLPQI